ncbi:HIT domain-containing protein, partial [Klebsiella pneumoniae]|nr:HIT family protein [Klebsiella pneumoniae]
MNDMQFPWLILVPRVPGITELYELSQADQEQFLRESSWLSSQLSRVFRADKMNVAALGNM